MRKKGSTYSSELKNLGKKLFGSRFKGVYAFDKIPKKIGKHECLIFNLDKTGQPGSHWCAMYADEKDKYVYDSFGRTVIKGLKHTEKDPEQKDKEENCGQRCIAWLVYTYTHGIKKALKI